MQGRGQETLLDDPCARIERRENMVTDLAGSLAACARGIQNQPAECVASKAFFITLWSDETVSDATHPKLERHIIESTDQLIKKFRCGFGSKGGTVVNKLRCNSSSAHPAFLRVDDLFRAVSVGCSIQLHWAQKHMPPRMKKSLGGGHVLITGANAECSYLPNLPKEATVYSSKPEQSRIQKLHCIQKLVFRNYFVVFRNYFVVFRNSCIQKLFRRIQKLLSSYSETISSYSETISSYSETISSYSETISSYSETISSYSGTIFVVFRNYSRRIQKLFSSYSETIFVVFRNFYSQTRGQCEQSHAWTVDAYSGWGGGVGLGQ